jgi:hypothetical protein
MGRNKLVTMSQRVSALLREHRLASYLVTAALILMTANAIRRVLPDDSHTSVITWVAISLMAYAGVAILLFMKRLPLDRRISVAWGVGVSPVSYGFAAGLTGSPVAVLWLGVAWSLILVAFVAITSSRAGQETGSDDT